MPSPALQKLETLPLTPLQSAPNSPGSSKPSSRRGSSTLTSGNHAAGSSASLASLRKLSMGAHTSAVHPSASGLSALSSRKSSTTKSTSADGTQSTEAPPSPSTSKLDTTDASAAAAARRRKESEEAIEQAVSEEQMLPEVSPVATSVAAASASHVHAESALDDDEDEDDDEADQPEGVLRTGNERFRTGSRRLSRMSSTLGEGITAHWKRSTPPVVSSPGQIKSPSQAGTPAAADTSPTTVEVQNVQKAQQPVQSTPMPPSALVQALRERQKRSPPSDRVPSNERVKAEPSAAALPSSAIPPGSPLHKSKDFARASGSSPPPLPKLPPIEHAKRLAAYRAVDVHVKPHHRVIGIGSGSTVPYVVDRLLEQGEEANRKRWFVPTGFQSKELIVNAGLKLGDVDQFPGIDVTIDGADDVDFALNAIKGGGACHLREKVLAEAAEEFIIVADYRKNNMLLGQSWKQGIPIETPAFAYSKVLDNLERIPGCIDPQLRMGKAKAGPLVTDNGNFVIDAPFDEAHMREPENLLVKIKMLTGVVEVGLFCGMARAAYFGNADGSVTVRWSDGQTETLKEGEEAKIKAETVDENSRPTDVLLTWQPQQPESETTTKTEASDISKLKQKLENLRMTST